MKNLTLLLIVALLLLCLVPMPYGYYQLVRFVAMVAFALMAWMFHEQKQERWMVTFGALALLFQPFIKIALGRLLWNIVDVLVAILLIGLFLKDKEKLRNQAE